MILKIALEFLDAIGIRNTQYAIVRHNDTAHAHIHIIVNKVDHEGKIIDMDKITGRAIKAAQLLTRKYGFEPEETKNLELVNREALDSKTALRYRLYEAIRDVLPSCRQLEDLEARLLEQGITTRFRKDPATGARVGISFRIEKYAFKGSKVDKAFSIHRLEQQLALQRVQEQQEKLKEAIRPQMDLDIQRELEQKVNHSKLTQHPSEERDEEIRQQPRLRM